MRESFKEIFIGLFNGNRGAAEQTAENIPETNMDSLTEEWERIRQERANYDIAMRKQYCNS